MDLAIDLYTCILCFTLIENTELHYLTLNSQQPDSPHEWERVEDKQRPYGRMKHEYIRQKVPVHRLVRVERRDVDVAGVLE